MRTSLPLAVSLALILPALCASAAETASAPAADAAAWLAPQDEQLLASLMKQFLFDPKTPQLQFGHAKISRRTASGTNEQIDRWGWLLPAAEGKVAKVSFIDGEEVSLAKDQTWEKTDFVDFCRRRYRDHAKGPTPGERSGMTSFNSRPNARTEEIPDLVLAAWLYRFGQAELAAKALERAGEAPTPYGSEDAKRRPNETSDAVLVRLLRTHLAASAFSAMVAAYGLRADDEALAHGQRLLKLFPEEAKGKFRQAATVVADLTRRKQKGTFGQKPAATPDGYSDWDAPKKIAWLIEALEEIDGKSSGFSQSQYGEGVYQNDRRIVALIKIGDPAVPALIEAIDKDERLTRTVRGGRYYRPYDEEARVSLVSVREAALYAVTTILRHTLQPLGDAAEESSGQSGDLNGPKTAAELRAYWKKYGELPLAQRMMNIVTDPASEQASLREAAHNLAHLDDDPHAPDPAWRYRVSSMESGPQPKAPLGSAATKFSSPTAAEAILAALDRDVKQAGAKPTGKIVAQAWDVAVIEEHYLQALLRLGDQRVADRLVERYRPAATPHQRRQWARAAAKLGNPAALQDFARDVEKGSLRLPSAERPSNSSYRSYYEEPPDAAELREIVGDLVALDLPETSRALDALAEPAHPYYKLAFQRMTAARDYYYQSETWFLHPFCLKILRRALDDQTPTGGTYRIVGNNVEIRRPNESSSGSIPPLLQDPKSRREEAVERVCDQAALKLPQLMLGLPNYHPLLKNADQTLETMKQTFDRFPRDFRHLTPLEQQFLRNYRSASVFVPNMLPLGRPATAADVKAGKAIFHLDGKGTLGKLALPAAGTLADATPRGREMRQMERVLVVQAEIGPDGKPVYGILGDGAARAAKGDEILRVEPIRKSSGLLDIFR